MATAEFSLPLQYSGSSGWQSWHTTVKAQLLAVALTRMDPVTEETGQLTTSTGNGNANW